MINIGGYWNWSREVGVFRFVARYGRRQFNKRILKRDCVMRLPTGNYIFLPRENPSATQVYVSKANIDWGSERIFARYADRKRDFLDIGSNIGYYSAYLSPLVRRSYAFEPDARNFPGLIRNTGFSQNIETVKMAVSSKNGVAEFFPGKCSCVSSLGDQGNGIQSVRVPVTTIDTFVAEHPGIDVSLVKTDAEGYDLEALRGMVKTVAIYQPLILSECGRGPEVQDLCKHWNYEIYGFVREGKTLKARFRHFPLGSQIDGWTHMMFLVPPALNSEFASFAAVS